MKIRTALALSALVAGLAPALSGPAAHAATPSAAPASSAITALEYTCQRITAIKKDAFGDGCTPRDKGMKRPFLMRDSQRVYHCYVGKFNRETLEGKFCDRRK